MDLIQRTGDERESICSPTIGPLALLYQLADPMTGSVVLRGKKSLLFCEQKRSKKKL